MTDEMINYIGLASLAVLYWFISIYRPKKLIKKPGELLLKSVIQANDKKLLLAVKEAANEKFITINNLCLNDIIHSPKLSSKKTFTNFIKKQDITHLILDDRFTPLLGVVYASQDDDIKLDYLASVGIGCCVFPRDTSYEDMVTSLTEALTEIQESILTERESQNTPSVA